MLRVVPPISIHVRGDVGGFRYVMAGRTTVIIRGDADRFAPGIFRVLLSRLDQDGIGTVVRVTHAAFYLPNLTTFSNPIDIGSAAMSYARRHPGLKAVYVVAPVRGLITNVVDFVVRNMPGLDVRMVTDAEKITTLLRAVDPDIPAAWFDLPT